MNLQNEYTIMKDKTKLQRCLIIALLLISFISIMVRPNTLDTSQKIGNGFFDIIILLQSEMVTVSLAHVIAALALVYCYSRVFFSEKYPFEKITVLVSLALSSFLILGLSFKITNSFDFIISSRNQAMIALLVWGGYFAIVYGAIKVFYRLFDTIQVHEIIEERSIFVRHFLLFSIITMLLGWAVLGFSFFPGSVPYDGRNQLNMFFGIFRMNLHHPFAATLTMGWIYKIGAHFFGPVGGCFLLVLFQSVLGAIVFSNICNYVLKKTRSILMGGLCLAFYVLAPMWWTYMQTIMKDTLYFIMFAWFIYSYIRIVLKDQKKYDYVGLVISAIVVCLFRNGSIIIVLPSILTLFFLTKGLKKYLFVSLLLVFSMNYLVNAAIPQRLHLKEDSPVEMYSIPLQQIARYVKKHKDEITEREKEIIDHVIEYDDLGERYDPNISDPVKKYHKDTSEEEWKEFWVVWAENFVKDPLTYLEATMNNVYGYTDPFYYYYGITVYQLYNKEALNDNDDPDVIYSEYQVDEKLRKAASAGAYIWHKIPLLSFVTNQAFYTVLGIVLLGAILRRRQYKLCLCYIAPFINVLICFASPVNAYVRYMLPVMAAMPLFFLIGIIPYIGEEKFTDPEKGL